MSSFQIVSKIFAEFLNIFEKRRFYDRLIIFFIFLTSIAFVIWFGGFRDFFGKFYRSGAVHFFIIVILISVAVVLILYRTKTKVFKTVIFPQNELIYLCLIGLTAVFLYSFHGYLFGMPLPQHGDEYSYLLMANTFADGRITNPAHPLKEFFDVFHIINYPSFMSKYPPGQGIAIAFGIILFGSPIAGVWLSGIAANMAVYWMLRGVFSRKWSLIGSLIALSQTELFSWSLRYYYGFVALLGVSLCLGAMLRTVRKPKTIYAVIFGLGIAILANSRPWEGLLACIPITIFLLIWFAEQIKNKQSFNTAITKFIIPLTIVLLINFIWMGFYNYRITGNAFKLPYSAYNEQYDPIPLFLPLFSPPKIDEYKEQLKQQYLQTRITRSQVMREFHLHEIDNFYPSDISNNSNYFINVFSFLVLRTYSNFLKFMDKSALIYIAILLAGVFIFVRNKKFLFFIGAFLFCFFLESFATYNQEHYYAPFVGFLFLAIVFVLSQISRLNMRASKIVTVFSLVLIAVQVAIPFTDEKFTSMSSNAIKWQVQPIVEESLRKQPGNHLVLADFSNADFHAGGRYEPISSRAFVNEPNIDDSRIVWANSLSEEQNKKLFDYFKDRQVWIMGFDVNDAESGEDALADKKLYPKLISCAGIKSDFQPNEKLASALLQICPR